MYSAYGATYQRPSSPGVFVPDARIQGQRPPSPVLVIPYSQQPGTDTNGASAAAVVDPQHRYYNVQQQPVQQVQQQQLQQQPSYPAQTPSINGSINSQMTTNVNQLYWQPVVNKTNPWPGQYTDHKDDDDMDDSDDNDDEGQFEVIDFHESLSRYPFYERVAYAMFYSRNTTAYQQQQKQQPVNILMILGSSGKFGFPGGHIEQTDRSVIDGLNRELREEINIKRKHFLNPDDHLFTLVRHNPAFVEHFYTRQVAPTDLVEMEKRVAGRPEWGMEIYGVIRVPLFVEADGFRGFPAFLSNMFMRNSRWLLLQGIELNKLMHRKQLKELVRASDKYLKTKLRNYD